ncbi:TPA: hypothetical protein DCE37_12510 [Candidatus Latescibacteria bacterium]|nr:hypothetical protein [Candidatus Latescibacterota bacterium]
MRGRLFARKTGEGPAARTDFGLHRAVVTTQPSSPIRGRGELNDLDEVVRSKVLMIGRDHTIEHD